MESGSVVISFEVSANETSLLRLLSRADRFERLVHADKLHLVYQERPLSIIDGGRFRFSFVYAEKPKTVWTSGVIIAVTIVACAVLLGVMLVGMVVSNDIILHIFYFILYIFYILLYINITSFFYYITTF